jgi:hypothetical protein
MYSKSIRWGKDPTGTAINSVNASRSNETYELHLLVRDEDLKSQGGALHLQSSNNHNHDTNNKMSKYAEPEIVVDVAAEEVTALTRDQKNVVDPLGSGFTWYTPPMSYPGTRHASSGNNNRPDWIIAGNDFQVLTVAMPPNETVITEVGSFMFGSADITMNVELTLCSGCVGCQRICGGESCVKLHLINAGSQQGVRPSMRLLVR